MSRRSNGCHRGGDWRVAFRHADGQARELTVLRSGRQNARVAIIGTGGLGHFCLAEEFDRNLIAAVQHKDQTVIAWGPPAKLKSGSGEIRNWIALTGALESLDLNWSDYIPCYRSPAGTGTGIAFAIWE
jgi:hypothetical protein